MKQLYFLLALLLPHIGFTQEKLASDTLYIDVGTLGEDYKTMFIRFGDKDAEKMSWRWRNTDSAQFGNVNYDDANWEKINNDVVYDDAIKQKAGHGVSWFRSRIYVDTSAVNLPVSFMFKGSGAAQIYWDGKLAGEISPVGNSSSHKYADLQFYPVFVSLGDSGTHVLAVRYENNTAVDYEDDSWGIALTVKKPFNVYKETRNKLIISSVILIGIGTLFFALFIVHTLFFLFYRKGISNFYFALFNLGLSMVLFGIYYVSTSELQLNDETSAESVMAISLIASCFALGAFTATLFDKKRVFLYVILVVGTAAVVTTLMDTYTGSNIAVYVVSTLSLLSVGYTLIQIIRAIYRKIPGARILGAGILYFFSIIAALLIISIINGRFSINNLSGFLVLTAFLSFPISISAFLAWQFSYISKNLSHQLVNVENLSNEKQQILESQNERLELQVANRTKELVAEKKKSDELLLNILPQEVAEELKIKGASKAQSYDEVSVLFTDFVNFTKISEQLGAEALLEELNINFTAFDRIMELHGLEKIKTIGDAYLAVSGLPHKNQQHALNATKAALDILSFVEKRKKEVPYGLDIRIGINSGSLVAGIVGVKKFAYDIWGDTVNTAARMEQNSEPGKINVSGNTYQLIKDEIACAYRGKIAAKGKGEMDMYFVHVSNK